MRIRVGPDRDVRSRGRARDERCERRAGRARGVWSSAAVPGVVRRRDVLGGARCARRDRIRGAATCGAALGRGTSVHEKREAAVDAALLSALDAAGLKREMLPEAVEGKLWVMTVSK